MTVQFFVDDGLIHVGGKIGAESEDARYDQLLYNNILLEKTYLELISYLNCLGLEDEADKLEMMHFIHKRKGRSEWTTKDPLGPPLRIRHPDGTKTVVQPKKVMRYLGFFLDPKLSWREHIKIYSNRGCCTVNTFRMLSNSVRGMNLDDKHHLFISNILPLITYGAQLWWNPQWKGIK